MKPENMKIIEEKVLFDKQEDLLELCEQVIDLDYYCNTLKNL